MWLTILTACGIALAIYYVWVFLDERLQKIKEITQAKKNK